MYGAGAGALVEDSAALAEPMYGAGAGALVEDSAALAEPMWGAGAAALVVCSAALAEPTYEGRAGALAEDPAAAVAALPSSQPDEQAAARARPATRATAIRRGRWMGTR
jgi:hypothetical protein